MLQRFIASIASLQAELLFEGEGAAGTLAGAGRRGSTRGARGAGAMGTTALADGTDGLLAAGGVAVGAVGSDAALAGGFCAATGAGRSGSASISSDRPIRSSSEASQSLTGHADLATSGLGGSAMPRLEEIV